MILERKKAAVIPVLIKDEANEVVSSWKYIGVLVDDRMDWNEWNQSHL